MIHGIVASVLQSGGDATDPYWANVKFLAGFNGTDGQTSYTSEDDGLRTGTAFGSAQLDTSQKVFGTSSAEFDGSADFYAFPDSDDFALGTQDFTVECWVRFRNLPGAVAQQAAFVSNYDFNGGNRGWSFSYDSSAGVLRLLYSIDGAGGGSVFFPQASWVPSANTWYYVACTREAGVFRFFVNGVLIGTESGQTGNSIFNASSPLFIGDMSFGQTPFDGWIDEVRLTVGVARYTATYAVPTEEFPRA